MIIETRKFSSLPRKDPYHDPSGSKLQIFRDYIKLRHYQAINLVTLEFSTK